MKPATTKAAAAAIRRHFNQTAPEHKPEYMGQYMTQTAAGPVWSYFSPFSIITGPDPLPDLPRVERVNQMDPVAYMKKAIDNAGKYSRWSSREYHAPAQAVTVAALKEYRKTEDGKKYAYAIQDGDQEIGVNARYMLDLLTIYPAARVFVGGPFDIIILADPETLDPVAAVSPVRLDINRKAKTA